MKDSHRQTRSHLMSLFEQQGLHPRRDLGQNFLIDLNLIQFVVRHAELDKNDIVLEIGTGTGGMTAALAQEAGPVISVEVDKNMHAFAQAQLGEFKNLTLLNTDALKNKNRFHPFVVEAIEQQLAAHPHAQLKLIANLPYNIATPVISNLVASEYPWSRMIATIQWELGLRMVAQPKTDPYGALSVWLQAQTETEILKQLPPQVFWPRPGVDSAIVQVVPQLENRARIQDRPFFQDYARRLFHQRRKLLRSVLVGMYRKQLGKPAIDEILHSLKLTPETCRAEELTPAEHIQLANTVLTTITDKKNSLPSYNAEDQ